MEKRKQITDKNLKIKFTEAEKRQLIAVIKKKQIIWDKDENLHSNLNAMKAVWRDMAAEINKPEDSCRQNWKSILDSKRYYSQRRKIPKKSGSVSELKILSDASGDPWEFSEDY